MSARNVTASSYLRNFRWLLCIPVVAGIEGFVWWNFLRDTPTDEFATLIKGRSALQRQDLKLAGEMAERLRPLAADKPIIWEFLGKVDQAQHNSAAAVQAYAELLRLQPQKEMQWRLAIGSIEMQRYRIDVAEEQLARVLEVHRDYASALRLRAQLESVLGRSEALVQTLVRLVQLRCFTLDDLLILATNDPFVSDLPRLAEIEAASPTTATGLAKARMAINDDRVEDALRYLREIPATAVEYRAAQGVLGKILAERDQADFLAWHQQLSPAYTEDARIWLARGIWLKRQGELEFAARALWEAVRQVPEDPVAMTQLSQTLRMKGEHDASAAYALRVEMLQRIRDLGTRTDEQQTMRYAPELVVLLEKTGRFWEAWAWSALLSHAQQGNRLLADETARLAKRLTPDLPQTYPDAIPGHQLNWHTVPLPDWSKWTASKAKPLPTQSTAAIRFRDDTSAAGFQFVFRNSDDPAVPGRFIFESTGGGIGVLDFDHDGWPDLYSPQAGPWPITDDNPYRDALHRNRLGKSYVDVTTAARIDERGYGQGLAVGDFDNDGFDDLYVANIGRNTLLRNNGDGTFSDWSERGGVTDDFWTVSAAFADFNGDGHPDVFDVNYLMPGEAFTQICRNERGEPRVCRPTLFEPALDSVRINQGDGTFVTSQKEVGLDLPHGMGLGIVVADFNADTRLDVFVANDQTPNYLLLNTPKSGGLGFELQDHGTALGVGLDQDGFAQACMGVAHGDVNHDGRLDLFVTNFSQESNTLYLSDSLGGFSDETRAAGLRAPSFALLGFGTQFLDADLDGHLDLVILNGHIDDFSASNQEYRMRAQVFQGSASGVFREHLAADAGEWFQQPRLGRGLAVLDWNRDGLPDFAASDLEGPASLLTNISETAHRNVRLQLVGTTGARDAVGATVVVHSSTGEVRQLHMTSGDGYESSSERRLVVSVPAGTTISTLRVRFPSGLETVLAEPTVATTWCVIEGRATPVRID
jgi:tetratricopeptide (TPR) repeat protein